MNANRRQIIESALFGTGYAGLKALATGLPVSVFLTRKALAEEALTCAAGDKAKAKYLIISTSSSGDPLNANVPGTYDFPDIAHAPPDPITGANPMAATPFKLGSRDVTGAQIWSTLPQWVLDRTVFFHHATLTNNHSNLQKVLRVMGGTAKQEQLPSIIAKSTAPCLGCVQTEPVSIGAGEILTIYGRGLPNLPPTGLRDVLTRPKTGAYLGLSNLAALRDTTLDGIYKYAKEQGSPAQKQFIDGLAMSRKQSRSLSEDLLGMLTDIKSDGSDGQLLAAVALIRMNVAPVIAMRFGFGGDNHTDADLLKSEVPGHVQSIPRIGALWETLKTFGLEDKVVFAAYNVFGRTLKKNGITGRDHWASHHATVMIGKSLKAGVVGGLEPKSGDYYATPIDSKSGKGVPGGGDIAFGETLGAMSKTLAAAAGLSRTAVDTNVTSGKVVEAALS